MNWLSVPSARWFEAYGKCLRCQKPSQGRLMSNRNDYLGQYCKKCAEMLIKHAAKPTEDRK